MGAIIYGYETARHLGKPFIFVERVDGAFHFRRGFSIEPGARILVVEDIVSTGLSAREAIETVRQNGGEVLALACLVDRSAGQADVGAPIIPLASLKVDAWPADELPAHLKDAYRLLNPAAAASVSDKRAKQKAASPRCKHRSRCDYSECARGAAP